MTRRFRAHFANGVIVPDEKVDLPQHTGLLVTVEEKAADSAPSPPVRHDDPGDPMPRAGVAFVNWWRRHALSAEPAVTEKFAQAKEYAYGEEPDDDA